MQTERITVRTDSREKRRVLFSPFVLGDAAYSFEHGVCTLVTGDYLVAGQAPDFFLWERKNGWDEVNKNLFGAPKEVTRFHRSLDRLAAHPKPLRALFVEAGYRIPARIAQPLKLFDALFRVCSQLDIPLFIFAEAKGVHNRRLLGRFLVLHALGRLHEVRTTKNEKPYFAV